MKKIILSIYLATSAISYSQINYEDIDWIIDQTQVMFDSEVDTLELDFDQDGQNDMRISSWSNHQGGIQTAIEVLMLDAVGFGGLQVPNNSSYISDCPSSGFNYQSITGYIYTSDALNPYANQYVKMPFRFQRTTGTHYGLLYVRYVGTTITIEGYAWNPTHNGPCDCNTTEWLSLKELNENNIFEVEKYFNLIGQEIKDPHGFVIALYKVGITKKIYIE